MLKIFTELDDIISTYETGTSQRIAGLYRSPFQVIKMCEYYTSSRYLKVNELGQYNKDGLGRDKPFYNIVNYRVSLAKTATDLDIKDIQIEADNPKHQVESMLLNREAYEWMKESGFSQTLNKMGGTRPKYGGYLLKKTTQDGKLKIEVMDWTKVYTDLTDIMGGTIVEEHNMTPVALKKKDGVWENVEDVIKAHSKLKTRNKTNKIKVYELLGELPDSFYNDFEEKKSTTDEEFTYSLQKYFIAEIDGKKFPLYCDKPTGELSDYYEYLSWEDQSLDLGRGVIEESEEAQVWTNDAVINEKLAMDLAGRAGIVTNSKKISGNILEHDHGKVYELGTNETATSINFAPSALGMYQNLIQKWRLQADDASSSYDATTGKQPPADTPYAQTALLNQIGMKPFDYKREEWGIHLTKIFNKWVLPYLIKTLKKKHILVSEFTDVELQTIDDAFAVENSNKDIIKHVLKTGQVPTPEDQANLIQTYKNHLKGFGKKRYLSIPDDFFNDIEAKVTVVTTGEQKNKAVILQSLSTILSTVIQSYNQQTGKFGVLEDPTLSRIFEEILEMAGAGVSPVSLGIGQSQGVSTPVTPLTGTAGVPTAQSTLPALPTAPVTA